MQVSFYIDEVKGKELDAMAVAAGQSRAEFIRDLINAWLELPEGFELPVGNGILKATHVEIPKAAQ